MGAADDKHDRSRYRLRRPPKRELVMLGVAVVLFLGGIALSLGGVPGKVLTLLRTAGLVLILATLFVRLLTDRQP
ncbi:hypothetical protein [Segeticoccus rhizosphaerae]|uniref:hypothetical protein n=1 Tax=Segeticoccus rhizosphaerae TaxID=1104777 RepID=UPI0010C10B2D|nr:MULTISPECIES: hypothetical protein [Intrasporangiaceae]